MSSDPVLTLAVTLGDPAGIGPEVIAQALADQQIRKLARFCIFGDPGVLNKACQVTGVRLDPVLVDKPSEIPQGSFGLVSAGLVDPKLHQFGRFEPAFGDYVLSCLEAATKAAVDGEVDAIVTGPINKKILSAATGRTEGHTELLARLTGAADPVMMLAGPLLRVVSLTGHASIRDLPELIQRELIINRIVVLDQGLKRFFGLRSPRIAVCALNPHGGEEGLYGNCERDRIAPAVKELNEKGLNVVGPLPSDTVFLAARDGEYDAVLAMYHDQAMIPIKLLHFAEAVNVTLGLPIIRTSPAHGTAIDIAGQGRANADSLKAAIRIAVHMAGCRAAA